MPRTKACRPAAPSGSTSPQGDQHKQDVTVPVGVAPVAAGRPLRLAWTNEAGGLTFEAGMGASRCFIKWAPAGSQLDLAAEANRTEWAGQFHPVPKPLARRADAAGSWLVTAALDGNRHRHLVPFPGRAAQRHGRAPPSASQVEHAAVAVVEHTAERGGAGDHLGGVDADCGSVVYAAPRRVGGLAWHRPRGGRRFRGTAGWRLARLPIWS